MRVLVCFAICVSCLLGFAEIFCILSLARRFVNIGCLALLRLSALLGLLSRVDQKFYEGISLENGRISSKKVFSSSVFWSLHFENSDPNSKPVRD